MILPRQVMRRLRITRLFYRCTWLPWSWFAKAAFAGKRLEPLLSTYGPLSLLFLIGVWAGVLIFGYALIHWALGPGLSTVDHTRGFMTDLYLSGTTFFTLGLGDVAPLSRTAKVLVVIETGMGLGFLALIIGYLPALNQSFSRREVTISMLDQRAGSPPSVSEMIRRNMARGGVDELEQYLSEWERWAAELLESHLSYPFLAYFRSHHDNQSWLGALTTILDTSALVTTLAEGACSPQARMTFAIARHAVVDLSIVFGISPADPPENRLPPADLARLTHFLGSSNFKIHEEEDARERLTELRRTYEPYVFSLASYFCLSVPPWVKSDDIPDNWQTSAWSTNQRGSYAGSHF